MEKLEPPAADKTLAGRRFRGKIYALHPADENPA
jgi:hypothetical protein